MATIHQEDFQLGWIPSEDEHTGRKNGLVRMDNLTLDENGAVSLSKGIQKVNNSQFASAPLQAYSKVIGGQKHRYVAMANGTIVKDTNEAGTFGTTVLTGGGIRPAFGSALDQVLILSSTQKKKDDGTTIRNLGIDKPTITSVTPVSKITKFVNGQLLNYTLLQGTTINTSSSSVQFETDTTGVGKVQRVENIDGTDFGGTGNDSEQDTFLANVRLEDSTKIVKIRFEFLLVTPPGSPDTPISDYYFIEFNKSNHPGFNEGTTVWQVLQAKRSDFTKVGNNASLDWADIKAVRVTCVATEGNFECFFTAFAFEGGTGNLEGTYDYITVNVYNSGSYIGKSPISDPTRVEVSNQKVQINPAAFPSGVNEVWIYRKKIGVYDTYYRVARRTDATVYTDNRTDLEVLEDGIAADVFLAKPPDNVVGIIGQYFDRTIYLTLKKLSLSPRFNPDAIDTRYDLDVSGDDSETNFWIIKVATATLLIGTSNDIYELVGTGRSLPDGTIDFIIRPLGIANPPISRAVTNYDGNVIYMASDGWRQIIGSASESIVGDTRLLYQNETRYALSPVLIQGKDQVTYSCAATKNKLWTVVTNTDLSRRVYVLDMLKRYWYPFFSNPVSLFVEEDGTILGAYGGAGDFNLRELDSGTDIDGTTQLSFFLTVPFLDGGQPNRRKGLKTLKLFLDTGGSNVNIILAESTLDTFVDLGNHSTSVPSIINLGIEDTSVDFGKSYRITITDVGGAGVADFKLYYWELDYDPRPEQVNYQRITPQNYGVAGRKRFYDILAVIDTFGLDVTVTPDVDGVAKTPFTVNTSRKETVPLLFTGEEIGTDIGWKFNATGDNVFELWDIIPPRNIEKLPDPSRFFHIPFSNLGQPSRKRFRYFAFVIDTKGQNVTFTPIVDGVAKPSSTVNTTGKLTYRHLFTVETEGFDIGGTLTGSSEFEFYGVSLEDSIFELLPPVSKFHETPCTNFGIPAKKRIPTVPLVIDTLGNNVTAELIIDQVVQLTQTLNNNARKTEFLYLPSDIVGIDYCVRLSGNSFEFYELSRPATIQIFPIARKWDQLGPIEIQRNGWLRELWVVLIAGGTTVNYQVYMDDTASPNATGTITTVANKEVGYRISFPKNIRGTAARIEMTAAEPFHRMFAQLRYSSSDNQTGLRKANFQGVPGE